MGAAYWSDQAGWRTGSNAQAEIIYDGHAGNIYQVATVTDAGQLDTTGSFEPGWNAVMISGSYNGTIELSGGGSIDASTLESGQIYNFSIHKISGGTAPSGIYAFKIRK